nr:immunoglobulin heavy chain junction region [Macaca mulatta]MOV87089.1 immunoglobulin heavy chain junction region [Macaca mulatta]MOV88115.1 immunoglobulin heavy chain junction region [Macaca mulatta]MOV88756.1 immunoglobulin heavy chain junction region [Macaca mulatta]MOV89076.1 immunoglobulin heavy chain junction region [Macaca mulatta]
CARESWRAIGLLPLDVW